MMMNRHGLGRLTRALLPALTMCILAAAPSARADLPPIGPLNPIAVFDWEMPARTGLDANNDGVIDARTTQASIVLDTSVVSGKWQVNFNACDSVPSHGQSIQTYIWTIDRGEPHSGESCGGFTHYFAEEGKYEITLEVEDTAGNRAHVIRDIVVQDWLIIALGDSYGSGQGNPDIPMEELRVENAIELLGERLAELTREDNVYNETVGNIEAAQQAYRALLLAVDICNPLSIRFNFSTCALGGLVVEATDALRSALLVLGQEALTETLGLVDGTLDELRATAQAALNLANQAVLDAIEEYETAFAGLSPVWQDRRCNRSAISGQAQAALALERFDPHTSVTLVHLACSGAEIHTGLLWPYAGVEPPPGASALHPQVDRARWLIGHREVDAVLISIGGNDVGFGDIAMKCIGLEPCHQSTQIVDLASYGVIQALCQSLWGPPNVPGLSGLPGLQTDCLNHYSTVFSDIENQESASEVFDRGIRDLPGSYGELALALNVRFRAVAADPARVFITEYPNSLQNEDEDLCLSENYDLLTMLPGITGGEAVWLRDTVTTNLNAAVAATHVGHGWTVVGGIYDATTRHGYCALDGWSRRIQDSFLMQGRWEGVAHPTAEAHAIYAEQIFAALCSKLYGDSCPGSGGGGGGTPILTPRLPNLALGTPADPADLSDDAPPVVGGNVPPSDPNAAGWYKAPVTIDWRATDPDPSSGGPSDPADTVAGKQGTNVYTSAPSCDPAGNCATGSITLSIDTKAPSVKGVPVLKPNSAGWYNAPVTIDWHATDPAPGSGSPSDPANTTASTEGIGVAYTSEPSCDRAGNCASGTVKLSIDTTQPEVTCPSVPVFQLGQAGATVTAEVADALSGPVAKIVTGAADTNSVGRKAVPLTGQDLAGNSRIKECEYIVDYVFGGFENPVNEDGVLNVVKAGRSVPLKWRLTDASGAPVLGLTTAHVTVTSLSCSAGVSDDLVEETTAGGSGLQNLGDGWYQLNWKTPTSYAGSCKTMRLDLGEGLVHTALFKFSN